MRLFYLYFMHEFYIQIKRNTSSAVSKHKTITSSILFAKNSHVYQPTKIVCSKLIWTANGNQALGLHNGYIFYTNRAHFDSKLRAWMVFLEEESRNHFEIFSPTYGTKKQTKLNAFCRFNQSFTCVCARVETRNRVTR